jgi:uncharacterized protein YecA (UPF0149 family)
MDSYLGRAIHRERPGRNDPRWCSSAKKYKNCHLDEDDQVAQLERQA